MPISPDPPRGRKTSSSCGVDRSCHYADVAGVDQHQSAHGEIGIDMIDGRDRRGRNRCASPPVATTVMGLPYSALMRVDQAGRSGRHSPNRRRTACRNGVRADHLLGAVDGDARQHRGGLVQRLDARDWRPARSRCRRKRRPRRRCRKWWRCRNRPRSPRPCSAHAPPPCCTSRSAPTVSGRSTLSLMPRSDAGSPTSSGSHLRYLRQRSRRSNSAAGTTVAMMAAVEIGEGQAFQRQQLAQPARHIRRRCAASGSRRAIGRASCRRRQTAKTMLVLPASMASSIRRTPRRRTIAARCHAAGAVVQQQRAARRRCLRTRRHGFLVRQPRPDARAQARGARQPGRRARSRSPRSSRHHTNGRTAARRQQSRAASGANRRAPRQRGGGKFGAAGECARLMPMPMASQRPARSAAFQQDAGQLSAVGQHVIGPFDA